MRKFTAFVLLLLASSSSLWAQLNVYYVNVGQGDATYIEQPTWACLRNSRSLSQPLRRHYMNTPAVRRMKTASWTHGLITKL